MGFDNDCILNIQSLAGEYFCAVCRTLVYPNEAIQAPCTHLYCKPCLSYVVSTTHACAYDGFRVTEADSKPLLESNKTLAETIGKIQVHCLYYRTGCTWQGVLSDCKPHVSTCAFGESAVLCNRCGIQLKHREVEEHALHCSGVQSQVQQPGGAQDNATSGAAAAPDQSQPAVSTGGSASQVQTSQASTPVVSNQDANLTANAVTQPPPAQVAAPTPEQVYQQQQQYQQQYQQYYQQYPGYDPYQQNYQYYYQYPQAAQQYQQTQAYPQAYGQPQPQGYGLSQTQPIVQAQQPVHPQVQTQPIVQAQQPVHPQVPSQGAQPPSQPQVQTAVNAQPHVPLAGQAQPHMQAQAQAHPPHVLPYSQSQPAPQAQAYTQPQHVPQQPMQVPQYAQTHPQMPHPQMPHPQMPHPQMPHPQMQPYPQSQTQHYSHPQPQAHSQLHSQPNPQAPVHPPQQSLPPSALVQTPNAVSGYQSYPQPQVHPQAHAGSGHAVHAAGALQPAQYPNQIQGQFPSQTPQMRPPQPYSNVSNQQQHAMVSAQGHPSGPSAQQLPVYPHAQQPGYPFQQHPPGQGAFMQTAQLQGHGPSQMPPQFQQNNGQPPQPNVAHNYAARPMGVQAVSHPHAQTVGHAGAGQVRPPLPNQNYPTKTNNQLSGGENSRDPMLEKGVHDQMDPSKEARDSAVTSSSGIRGDEPKLKDKDGLAGSADETNSESYLAGSKQMPDAEVTKVDSGEGVSVSAVVGEKGGAEETAFNKAEVQDVKHTANNAAGSAAPPSALHNSHFESQVHGANSLPSIDHGRNQLQPMPYAQHKHGASSMPQSMTHPVNSQQSSSLAHPSNQSRPQEPGQAPSSGSVGRPGNVNQYQGNLPPHQAGQPQNPSGDPHVGPPFTAHSHRPSASRYEIENFAAQRTGYFDGRSHDAHSLGPLERNSFGPGPHGIQARAMKFGGPPPHDSMPAPGMRDERAMPFVEEHLKHFSRREFEDDLRNFPRPPHLEAGPSNHGPRFPPSGPLDHGSRMFGGDGMLRSFDKGPRGFDRDPGFKMDGVGSGPSKMLPPFNPKDVGERGCAFPDDDMRRTDFNRPDFSGPSPGPGFGPRHMDGLPPRSPGRDYPGFPSRTFGPYGDVVKQESRSFERGKAYNFPPEPFGKPTHESRFPVPPRGDLDIPGNLRGGEHLAQNQDLMPGHLSRGGHLGIRSLHLREAPAFGRPSGLSQIDPPLGNFPPHIPFGDRFGVEKPHHPMLGEPGFRSGFGFPRHEHDGGFHPREMEPFDNPRKRKPGSIMCRICKVECGTVEGLDLHSQSREHQRKARDIVLSIKQQNKKKQKLSKDQASVEDGRDGGRPKNSGFQGRGNMR